MKTSVKLIQSTFLFLLSIAPMFGLAQDIITPYSFYQQRDFFIRDHDNHKYYQDYTNHNGHIYMYYNKTYNNKSKDLHFYEINFNQNGLYVDSVVLAHPKDDLSDDLYFEKDITMNAAFFGVGDYLFAVVQNKKHEKNEMYRLNLTTKATDIVLLDNGTIYDRYFSAVTSGYDVLLFTRKYVESYTYSTTDNNLHFNERRQYALNSTDAAAVSAVALIPPGSEDVWAYAAIKDPDHGTFQICAYNFNDLSDNYYVNDVFDGKAMRLVSGRSFGRETGQAENTDGSAYISIFSTKNEKYKGDNDSINFYDKIPVYYGEIKLNEEGFDVNASMSMIAFPFHDAYAKIGDDALIDIVEHYVPVDCTNILKGNDGFKKLNILINCNRLNETYYSSYHSDAYLINTDDDPPVQTDMLPYNDAEWKKTWTLVGIFDGAPPCALDWETWEELHHEAGTEIAPTELEWEIENKQTTDASISTDISWSIGCKGKGHIPLPAEPLFVKVEAGGKYAQANELVNSLSSTTTVKQTIYLPLTEENQHEAVWFWLVPTITRFAYSVYDYTDHKHQHPIMDRTDYAFITTNYTLRPESVPISMAPHYISEPNAPDMHDWVDRGDTSNDTTIAFQAFYHGLSSQTNAYYEPNYGGTNCYLIEENEQTTEQKNTNTYSVELGLGIGIPEIFEFGVSGSYDYEYTSSNAVTTTFTQSVGLELSNLKPASAYTIYPDYYVVHPYLFTPDDNPFWWYFYNDSLLGYKPWFIAYTVSLGQDKSSELITQIKPENNEVFYVNEPLDFWWTDSLKKTKLVISNAPTTSLKAIVYQSDPDTKTANKVSGLPPGDYFWRVAGINDENFPVWSEFRKFTVVEKDFLDDNNTDFGFKSQFVLPAKVYPNPSYAQNVSVTYEVKDDTSPVEMMLYDMSGAKIWATTYAPQETGIHNKVIPTESLMTHFGILRIINGNYIATQKIAVY